MTVLRSSRLTLRPVCAQDLPWITSLNADPQGMAMLGGARSPAQVAAWLERELAHFERYGYCRNLVTYEAEPVGLVGLTRADLDRGVAPGIEVAWNLAHEYWGRGFATEAAQRVIEEAFSTHAISELVAITSIGNARSRRVMERLGMHRAEGETFEHPHLPPGHPLRTHVVYRLGRP